MIYLIPALFLAAFLFAALKKVNTFDAAVDGVKEGAHTVLSLFPHLVTLFLLIALFRASGISALLANWLEPLFSLLGIPKELSELILLRPISGSGSLVILENLFRDYGADSYIGRTASVLMGASDTILYIAAIYFSAAKDKRSGPAIPIALAAMTAGTVFTCLICRVM